MEERGQLIDDTANGRELFAPQETLDNPFDITLMAEDGTEFRAHKQIISKASPFFEKLLNCDMIESMEGVARLEMFTEAGLRDILEFIYTGRVQILTEDNARDLIEMADYLFMPQLQDIAGKLLAEKLDTSSCISTYYLAERYHSDELFSVARKFIFSNFAVVCKAEEFRNLSSEEVERWISSDEIVVSSEEEIFQIILFWISLNKSKREKYFAKLFSQVRLVYVARDYISSEILTNHLVSANECCLKQVKAAMKAVESGNSENLSFPLPRKSLETTVIAVSVQKEEEGLMCYVPSKNSWYNLRDTTPLCDQVLCCHGKLYFISKRDKSLLCYDAFFGRWVPIDGRAFFNRWESIDGRPYEGIQRDLQQLFVTNQRKNEIYALESENEASCRVPCVLPKKGRRILVPCGKQHLSYITKYKPDTNTWEDISSFDLGLRKGVCIVTKENQIYLIGGVLRVFRVAGAPAIRPNEPQHVNNQVLTDVVRYDLAEGKWEKLAQLHEQRERAFGAATQDRIFITGGSSRTEISTTCEVYDIATNEWIIIANRRMPRRRGSMMCVDGKIFVIDGYVWNADGLRGKIECYEPDENKWKEITEIPVEQNIYDWYLLNNCPLRVFKGANLKWSQVVK